MDIVEYNPANANRHPWELVRAGFVMRLIRRVKKKNDNLLILDMGCGDCFFSQQLLERMPATVVGIDPAYSPEDLAAKRASITQAGFHLFNNLGNAMHLLTKPVDLVLLLDVIEHIPDDISFLKELSAQPFIDHQTRFIITVPSYQRLFTSHDQFLLHYRRYNNTLLKNNTRKSGLEPEETGYFFFSLLPVRIVQKWKERLTKKSSRQEGLGGWKHGKLLTGIVKSVLAADVAIGRALTKAGIKMPGLSNYTICRKPVS